jgi:hypothetical protein
VRGFFAMQCAARGLVHSRGALRCTGCDARAGAMRGQVRCTGCDARVAALHGMRCAGCDVRVGALHGMRCGGNVPANSQGSTPAKGEA